ncbi:ferredoxin reductase [Alkanindiges sp. WGS2144]|uniref:ferredoxin reductase n=1 Tax=Alkanindiges sp. WGS2144 TaxID=3366808 RepID=UPI00375076A2
MAEFDDEMAMGNLNHAAHPTLKSLLQHTLNPDMLNFWLGKLNPLWSVNQAQARIVEKKPAARDMITLLLKPNRQLKYPKAGQHIIVTAQIDGRFVSRSYSTSAVAEHNDLLAITVKQVSGGRLSTWLCQSAKAGDVLQLGQPFGDFYWPTDEQPVLLLAAGSGITPMISLLRQYAAQPLPSKQAVQLHYWVSQREQACFVDELLALQKQQPNFSFHLYLTQQTPCQPYEQVGRIEAGQFSEQEDLASSHVLACGPAGFVQAAQQVLQTRVHSFMAEAFSPPVLAAADTNAMVQITLQKQQRVIEVPVGQPILAALEAQGINPPSGCRMGICNTCACGKVSGSTRHMVSGDEQHDTDPALRICISSARSDLILDL